MYYIFVKNRRLWSLNVAIPTPYILVSLDISLIIYILATIKFDKDRLEIISRLENSIKLIESYGFVVIYFGKYSKNGSISIEFCYE